MRSTPCQKLVGQPSERVDVGRRRHGLTTNLFWCGVLRRHRPAAEPRQRFAAIAARLLVVLGLQNLRDAEVEEFDLSFGRNERVRGLEIAMHDEILVRVRTASQHRGK